MTRARTFGLVLGSAIALVAIAAVRHARGTMGRKVPGGILVGSPSLYDKLGHRLLLGSLLQGVAAEVAQVAPDRSSVLEVGCGPGRLSILLARDHDLAVTGLDLDPAMIELARANAERSVEAGRRPSFVVGDVASLAFPDRSFDIVVSTLSMHHWTDPAAGLAEITRVLRLGGRALIWDFRPERLLLHGHLPDPVEQVRGSQVQLVSATPWKWPWRFTLIRRIELLRPGDASAPA